MWLGYLGLTIAYICLVTITLWILIRSSVHIVIKVILIAFAIWYGSALYYAVPNFMGWSTTQSIPDRSRVLSVRIQEPNPKENISGAIYLWLNIRPVERKVTLSEILDPRKAFLYYSKTEPRAYKLDYRKMFHKRVLKAQKRKRGTPGGQMVIKKKGRKGKGKKGEFPDDQIKFEIINPITLLLKQGIAG